MRYTYYFKDTTDTIISDPLTKSEYDSFIIEFKKLNSNYDFEVYLGGGYLKYLTKESETYTDIDFFIMAEKIIDLDDLTAFFKEFHGLAKKYKFAYDLLYLVDATAEDLNMDLKSQTLLNIQGSKTIKLYRTKAGEKYHVANSRLISNPIPDTELFENEISNKNLTSKFISKSQTHQFFQKPIKIS
jgi:hypothetical protein